MILEVCKAEKAAGQGKYKDGYEPLCVMPQ